MPLRALTDLAATFDQGTTGPSMGEPTMVALDAEYLLVADGTNINNAGQNSIGLILLRRSASTLVQVDARTIWHTTRAVIRLVPTGDGAALLLTQGIVDTYSWAITVVGHDGDTITPGATVDITSGPYTEVRACAPIDASTIAVHSRVYDSGQVAGSREVLQIRRFTRSGLTLAAATTHLTDASSIPHRPGPITRVGESHLLCTYHQGNQGETADPRGSYAYAFDLASNTAGARLQYEDASHNAFDKHVHLLALSDDKAMFLAGSNRDLANTSGMYAEPVLHAWTLTRADNVVTAAKTLTEARHYTPAGAAYPASHLWHLMRADADDGMHVHKRDLDGTLVEDKQITAPPITDMYSGAVALNERYGAYAYRRGDEATNELRVQLFEDHLPAPELRPGPNSQRVRFAR